MFTKSFMKLLPLTAAMTAALMFGAVAHAQTAAATAPETRAQVKMDTVDFLKTHRYDDVSESWVLKSGVEPPAGVKSRAEVKAERDAFLRANKYSEEDGWVPLKEPRDLGKMTRAQVKDETRTFLATHTYDELKGAYVDKPERKAKTKTK